ncbi:Dual specificity mitogen-activated protein kinase kinase sek-1 [Hypsibius exemplaris]|uniref:mitogen-activated protein kinase kinase n=1 Tax=Hypsibius exemplaris TaxID=2072580 RepID=A0A1W0WW34_HYPEX|nr:Dual specificity mitogen-activated protein kinase kinase sek-1 [Hypsibius exemplaris]
MSLPRKARPRPPMEKLTSSTPPRSPSVDQAPRPDLGSSAPMTFNGVTYDVSVDDLEILYSLGRGQYGHVDRVRHKKSGFEFAVKRIRSTDDPAERKAMLMDLQVNNINGGKCPYVVRSFGALFREGDLWICMEAMDISLEMFYKKAFQLKIEIPESVLAHITFAIVSGLQFLKEELNIMHRDVKPSNVLLSRKGEVKICDFGISGQLVQSMAKTRNIGCSLYMPPERVDPCAAVDDQGFDIRSDVWSVGITIIEVAIGKHPFTTWRNPFEQMKQVVSGPPPKLPDNGPFSDNFKHFVASCCQKDYLQRPKYVDLLKHPFISQFQEEVSDISEFVGRILDAPAP